MLGSLLLVVVVLALGVLYARWIVSMFRRSRHTKPAWVVRRLEQQGIYTVKIGPFTSVWTPERGSSDARLPMGFYQMPGRGSLTYSLDRDGETVRLVWHSQAGSQREWVGPIPFVATEEYRRSIRRAEVTALALTAVLALSGAVLGLFTGAVLAGLAGGLVAGIFVWSTVLSDQQMGAFRRAYDLRRKQAGRGPVPSDTGAESGGSGPVPAGGHPGPRRRRARRAAVAIYGTVLMLGFVLGFVLVSGSGVKRFLFGVLGLLLATAVMSLVSSLIRAGVPIRGAKQPGTGKTPLS